MIAGMVSYMILSNGEDPNAAPDPTPAPPAYYTIINLNKDELEEIEITSADTTTQLAKKVSGEETTWYMPKYSDVILNQTTMQYMCGTLGLFNVDKIFLDNANEADLSEYGLDKPQFVITAKFTGSTKIIRIGAATVDAKYLYLSMDGDESIYLIDPQRITNLIKPTTGLVDITTTIPETGFLTGLKLERPNEALFELALDVRLRELLVGDYELGETHAGYIFLQSRSPLNGANIAGNLFNSEFYDYVYQLSLLTCESFDQNGDYGFDEPKMTLLLQTDTESMEFVVGAQCSDTAYYCRYSGRNEVFSVYKETVDLIIGSRVMKTIDSFVSLPMIDTIGRIDVNSGEKSYVAEIVHEPIENDTTRTVITANVNGKAISDVNIRDLYRTIITPQYSFAVTDVPEPSGDVLVEIIFYGTDGYPLYHDRYYNYNADFYTVTHNGQTMPPVSKFTVDYVLEAMEKAAE